jgi:hypothetical protein
VRHADLTGDQATTIVKSVPAQAFNWTPLRAPTGEVVLVSWRYLLPDE